MERRLFFYTLLSLILIIPLRAQVSIDDSLACVELKNEGRRRAMAGDFDEAEKKFLEALSIDSNYVPAINNLGTVYKYRGRYNDALKYYNKAADIEIQFCGVDCEKLASIYQNIGNIHNGKQDYELALQYFSYVERIVEVNEMLERIANSTKLDLTDRIATSIQLNFGNVYFNMGEFRMALNSYKKGIEIKKKFDPTGLDVAYSNIASTYENLDRLDSAKLFYELSIDAKKRRYEGDDHHQLIGVYNNYGALLSKMEQAEKAYEYLIWALKIANAKYSEKHPVTSSCHRFLGDWYLLEDNVVEALNEYHKAIISVVYDFNDKDPFVNPSLENEILSDAVLLGGLREKSIALKEAYIQNKDIEILKASLETLELSNLLTEKMRSGYHGQESKLFITEVSHEGYSRAINTAYDLYKLTGQEDYANMAFKYAEKSKSSVLLASLQEVENKKNLGIPASIQLVEEDIKSEIELLKKKMYEERQRETADADKLGNWQGELIMLNQQLDSLNNIIRDEFPEYASKYDNVVIDLSGVKQGLHDDEVLIEYSFTDTSMFIFYLGKNTQHVSRMPIGEEFYHNVDVLSQFLRNNDFANNTVADYQAYTSAAYGLYQVLLGGLEDKIAGKKLIIIPDGELGYIPFEALLTSEADAERMEYRSLEYLIYKYSTSYSYSATILFSEKADEREPTRQLLAFAPTYEHVGGISDDKFPAYRDFSNYLVPLRFISQEIENISNIMDCDRYENYEATELVFREQAPEYDILHLAMHTLINDENPMYSQLVFTLNNDTVENNDGLLNTYEIFNINLSARMAVLSACNTGYGKLRKGEGIMSLARGFIYAGVPSIIMTLWAVEDQSGSILMSKFYENLVDGLEIDVALRQAKLQYLERADQLGAHPYLWSGYVSIGSTEPLVIGGMKWIYLEGGFGILLLAFIIFWILRKKRA